MGLRTTLFEKLYVDAGYYLSFYRDFLGYKIAAGDVTQAQLGIKFAKKISRSRDVSSIYFEVINCALWKIRARSSVQSCELLEMGLSFEVVRHD